MQTPELRASLEFAYRIFVSDMATDLYVSRDGLTVVTSTSVEDVQPSGPNNAFLHFIAVSFQAQLNGHPLADIRDQLVALNVGEAAAQYIYKHLLGISGDEWALLRRRVAFYTADDNTALNADQTEIEG
jgi:hypothetical protein